MIHVNHFYFPGTDTEAKMLSADSNPERIDKIKAYREANPEATLLELAEYAKRLKEQTTN